MEKQNFIFAYNPKVACTNWKCILRYLNGSKDYLDPAKAHDKEGSGLTFLCDIASAEYLIKDTSIPKYAFVRNPYDRVLSAYLNKIEPYTNGQRTSDQDNTYFYKVFVEIDAYRSEHLPSKSCVDFYCFLHWLDNVDDFHTNNEHWKPQSELLNIDKVNFDFIGKLENITHDAPTLLEKINCGIEFPSQKDVKFAPTKASEKKAKYYSNEEKKLANKIFSKDFKAFSYLNDDFLY